MAQYLAVKMPKRQYELVLVSKRTKCLRMIKEQWEKQGTERQMTGWRLQQTRWGTQVGWPVYADVHKIFTITFIRLEGGRSYGQIDRSKLSQFIAAIGSKRYITLTREQWRHAVRSRTNPASPEEHREAVSE